ncbi:AMP-binding protein [Micromonospora sp. WMMD1102]|uniref:AMP-binding protein n=1 Tax=Micromonospora sp. WMMD1102 TaxID=3016105 RepID=UPI0024158DA3|nr:AMP-binding protein [Micromonospora sp. WMMD1102]MDG4785092.1 AMP-binding protein [Micromonospora sp. WMMD1102]
MTGLAAPDRLDDLIGCGEPEQPAVTFRDATLSYRQLRHEVVRAAAGLRDLGVRRGDRVVVHLEKRLETVVALLAVARAGAVVVPANPVFRPRQLGHVVADCAATAIVTTPDRYDLGRDELRRTTSVRHVILVGSDGTEPTADATTGSTVDGRLAGSTVDGPLAGSTADGPLTGSTADGRLADSTADGVTDGRAVDGPAHGLPWRVVGWESLDGPDTGAVRVIDEDVAAILYTSGSTGGPKGVVLTHRNLIAGARSVAGYLGHTADDVILAALPLSFDAGLSQLTTTLIAGGHVVLVNFLLPGEVVKACARHRVTGLTGVPPLWIKLAAPDWPAAATRQLRYFANTGGRMSKTTLDRLRSLFPDARPFLMYGLTEAFRATYLDPREVDRRPDSIGRAIPNAEVLVVRPDGQECEPYEHGEIVQRGALVARGYWNDPERTASRFRPLPGGVRDARAECGRPEIAVWSGDLAYRDEEGFLYFVGRTDEMIKTCGYRVSPTEIEEAAYATGLVVEAVALGRPDEQIGEHIVLVVAGDTDERTLRTALSGTLPGYQRPREVVIRAQLPRSPNGKFDRAELRRQLGTDGGAS